jgi:hypothetical protein
MLDQGWDCECSKTVLRWNGESVANVAWRKLDFNCPEDKMKGASASVGRSGDGMRHNFLLEGL